MTNDSQQPAPFPAGGNQPTTSGSNDAPTQFIPPTEQSVPPTQTMPPVQDVPAQTPSYNDRVYAASLQQVMQAVHDQLSTSATFTVDEENVAEGTVTFHAYDGAQFTLKASAQGADGTAIKLDVTGDDGGTRTAEFLSVLDPALALPTAAPADAANAPKKENKAWKILNNPRFTGASGNRSKLAIAALVYSILMVLSTFAPAALEWGMLFSMAFISLLLTFAALYVTRPGGKVTGQLFAWIAAVLTVLGFVIGSVGIVVSGALEKAAPAAAPAIERKAFSWPKTNIGTKLPTSKSTTGGNFIEHDDMLSIDVCDTNDEQYAAYIDAVLEKGFTVDYSRSDGWFSGETKDGYSVTISRDESNKDIMSISLYGPDDSSTSDTSTSSDTSASNSSNFPSIPARSAPATSRTTTRSWLDARRNLRPSASDAVFGTPPIHIRKKDSNGFLDQIQNKQQAFSKAIPGTEALAGTLKDTFGVFRNGLGIAETRSSGTCEGCGAPLSGHKREVVRCEYCNRETQLN